jgi:DNA primase
LGETVYDLDWEPPPPAIKTDEPLPFIDFPPGCVDLMSPEGLEGALYVKGRNVPYETAKLYGLKYNPVNRRVYIPINHGPYMVGWQARLIDNDPEKKKVLFPKGIPAKRVLMGYNQAEAGLEAANGSGALCVVEGPFDMLRATAYNLIFGLATMGKNYGMAQVDEIAKLSKKYRAPVYVGYDPDAFETGQAQGLCNELLSRGIKVLVFRNIPGKDIGELDSNGIDALYAPSNVIQYDMGDL